MNEVDRLKRQIQGLEYRNENLQYALIYAINELIPEENIPPGARNNVFGWLVNKGKSKRGVRNGS